MTLKGKSNHYNIKFLKGYGFSISVKDSKIILKNTSDPFKEPEVEEWFVSKMKYLRAKYGDNVAKRALWRVNRRKTEGYLNKQESA